MTEERAHGLLSGSSAHIWTQCTGSVFLSKELPPEPPSVHASKGTLAHEITELLVVDKINYHLTGSDPKIRTVLTHSEGEELELATVAAELLWEKVLGGYITGKTYGMEDRFVIDEKFGMYGHVDFWCIEPDDKAKTVLKINDYKFGVVYVAAKKNAQLAFYAYAGREEIRRAGGDIDYVKVSIIQPKWEKEPYREAIFTNKQLDTWGKKFYASAHQIFVKQKPKFKVGEWCQYCKAKTLCPKYQKELSTKTSLKLIDGDVSVLPEPERVPDEVIRNIVLRSGELEKFLKACKAYVINRFREGRAVIGTKVVEGKSKRTWIKDPSIGEGLQAIGITEPYSAPKLKGVTVIEKELKKLLGSDKAAEVMQQLVTKTNPPLLLVGEDDDRPAIQDFAGMLSEVEDDDE